MRTVHITAFVVDQISRVSLLLCFLYLLVEQKWFTDILDLGYCTLEVEGFREDDFEYLQ